FNKDAKLVRSTSIPRSIWVGRIVLSKGTEFVFSLPVLALFAIFAPGTSFGWGILWFPVAVLRQAMLLVGLGLMVAPLCVLFSDLERTTRLILRALFYATPIVYAVSDFPVGFGFLGLANPLAGIFTMYRAAFFPDLWSTPAVFM